MALLRRPVFLRDAVLEGPRWIRSTAAKWVDGEAADSLFDIQLTEDTPADETEPKKVYPPAQVTVRQAIPRKAFQIPTETIHLSQIRPEFASTAAGQFLHGIGFDGTIFERFAERNPRAFHLTQPVIQQWTEHVKTVLSMSDRQLGQMLECSPKLLSLPLPHIDRTIKYLQQKFKLEDMAELRQVVMSNPFIFEARFEVHCNRGVTILFERFKVPLPDLKRSILRYPRLLTEIDEAYLLSLASLFESLIGMSPQQVGRMIRDAPEVLSQTLFGVQERLSFLVHYQVTQNQICEMLLQCPELLNTRLTAELRHVVNFLEATLNAEAKMVRKIIVQEPSVFKLDTEKDILPNLAVLKNLGFSRNEATLMIVRCPQILTMKLNDAGTQRKLKFLFTELGKDRSVLLTYPNYLACSWTENLLPRVAFLKHMNLQDYKEWPLMKLFGDSDAEFCTRHVKTVPQRYRIFRENWTRTERTFLNIWAPEMIQEPL